MAYFTDENVGRASVEQQVMDIEQKMNSVFCLHDLETVEWSLLEIEGAYELILVAGQLCSGHRRNRHIDRHCIFCSLYDSVTLCSEVDVKFGMAINDTFNGTFQLLGINTGRISKQIGNIIDGRCRVFETFEIDTCLSIGKRECFLSVLLWRSILFLGGFLMSEQ